MQKMTAIFCLLFILLSVQGWAQNQADSNKGPDLNSAPFAFTKENMKVLSAFACGFSGTVSLSVEAPYESQFYRLSFKNVGQDQIQITGHCGIRLNVQAQPDLGDEFQLDVDLAELKKAYYANQPMIIKGTVGQFRFKFQFNFIMDLELRPRLILDSFHYYTSAKGIPEALVNLVEKGTESLSPNKTHFFAWSWMNHPGATVHAYGNGARSGHNTVVWTNSSGRVFMNQQTMVQFYWGNGRGGSGVSSSDFIMIPFGQNLWKGCSTFLDRGTEKLMNEEKCLKRIKDFGI